MTIFLELCGYTQNYTSLRSRIFMKPPSLIPEKTIFLVDGSSFLYRAYYGLKPLHTKEGMTIQAVYGFIRMIQKLMKTFSPHYLGLVWDSPGQTAREVTFPAYKATRQAPPSDLFEQKKLIQEFADLIGLYQVSVPGVEADDLMYSLAQDFHADLFTTVLITSDKDLGQAVAEDIFIFDPFKDVIINTEYLANKYGFPVEKLPFYFALIGDTSDNIPGVRGIGPKGATDLVTRFDSLEHLYKNLDDVPKERTRLLLEQSREDAFVSLHLFTLRYYELDIKPDDFRYESQNWQKAGEFFGRLNFTSLLKDITPVSAPAPKAFELATKYSLIGVESLEQLQEIVAEIRRAGHVAIDTETNGITALEAQLVGISVSMQKGKGYYIPVGHKGEGNLPKAQVIELLKPVFEEPRIKKYMQHANFDQLVLSSAGIEVQGLTFDTLIAASLVTQDWQRIGLKYLSSYYLHEEMLSFDDVVKKRGYKTFDQVPIQDAVPYAAADAHQTLSLVPVMQEELIKHDQQKLFDTIEMPLVNILFEIEKEGIFLDTAVLKSINDKATTELNALKQLIIEVIGENYKNINLNSPKQLQELLFEHLKLEPLKKTGQKTGYSTDQEVLEELAKVHVVPGLILKYRELFKLKSTYLDALPSYVNPKTGRIHTTLSQTAAATGRLASFEPNLQNIPADAAHEFKVRSAFKPPENCYLISADYSQIELRVLAYLSQDETLIKAFTAGEDIHARTATGLFDVPLNAVTHEQRQVAKRINFSILYGLTPYGLSKDLHIPFNVAKLYIEKYLAQYPGVTKWMENVITETKNNGYVTTLWGRRRYIPGIYEKNKSLYELARRIAINTVAQGTAAEIVKLGMLALDTAFKQKNLGAKMVLQIHDELLVTAPQAELEETTALIRNSLQNVVQWNIPLVVTISHGKNWQEVTK